MEWARNEQGNKEITTCAAEHFHAIYFFSLTKHNSTNESNKEQPNKKIIFFTVRIALIVAETLFGTFPSTEHQSRQ